MKVLIKSSVLLLAALLVSCGGKKEEKKEGFTYERTTPTEKPVSNETATKVKASEKVDLTNKGIGPVKSVTVNAEIDQAMAAKGKEVYNQLCLACHKPDKKFIGPAPKGILERRTPEWIMNMILNPEQMVKEDPLAKELLLEFNGSPMANQGLTQEQARQVLEYFRTL